MSDAKSGDDTAAGSGNIERRDTVSVNGRQGIVNIDLRPEHNFVQVVWLDEKDGKGEVVSMNEITLVKKGDPNEQTDVNDSTPAYGHGTDYWNDRYQKSSDPFEWLEDYRQLHGMIAELTKDIGGRSVKVLHVGCGNSMLTEKMYDDGYENIVNIDTSDIVIAQMLDRNRHRTNMTWSVMDATQTTFSDDSFDLILDKSVLDTFCCMSQSSQVISRYLDEVRRLMRPGGSLLCVSFGDPSSRLHYFNKPNYNWTTEQIDIPPMSAASNMHYAYICKVPGK